MNEFEMLREVDLVNWLFVGLVIISCFTTTIVVIEKFCEFIGKPMRWLKSKNTDHDLILKLVKDFNEFKESQDKRNKAVTEAQMESMCDRIEQKCKNYIELNGIPEDEYDSFVRMFKAYQGIGGNHGAEAKYNYCINNLKIIPDKK